MAAFDGRDIAYHAPPAASTATMAAGAIHAGRPAAGITAVVPPEAAGTAMVAAAAAAVCAVVRADGDGPAAAAAAAAVCVALAVMPDCKSRRMRFRSASKLAAVW